MSSREKKLASLFGSLLAVILIVGVGQKFIKNFGISDKAAASRQLAEAKSILQSKALWEDREIWMTEHVSNYSSEAVASAELLERITQVTRKYGVSIESWEIIKIDPERDYE